jgi:hypothetical protein
MILKALVMAVASHAQASGDGTMANGKDRLDPQSLGIFPDRLGKKRLSFTVGGNSSASSVGIMKTLMEKKSSGAYVACLSYFKDPEWIKSS